MTETTTPRHIATPRRVTWIAVLALLLSAAGPHVARAMAANPVVTLVPHRAVYDMVLDSSRESRGVAAVAGRMVFDFSGSACEGYTLNIRLVTRMTGQSGTATTTDLRSSTWEHGKGRQFRFNSTQYRDETLTEVASGKAQRAAAAAADVMVDLTKPEPASHRYAGPILFPTQHSVAILSAAMAGKRIVQAKIFDGSEKGRKLYNTTAFIGRRVAPGAIGKSAQTADDQRPLAGFASWPVTISYFDDADKDAETPDYELSFRLYANGVSRDILINYGTFAIKGRLSSLKLFERPDCK